MSSVQVLPLANYPNGTHGPFGPIDLADDVTSSDFSIARCTTATPTIWPNVTTTIQVLPEVSIDGGVTWQGAGGFSSAGGIAFAHNGSEQPFAKGGGNLPIATGRKFRVTAIIAGGPLRSSATVEIN